MPKITSTASGDSGTFTVTLTLPKRVILRNHEGKPVVWDLESTVPLVGDKLAVVGGRTVLTNVWNGGGANATATERLAAVTKKLDSWKRGEFNVVERGESALSGMREAFVDDFRKRTSASEKEVQEYMRQLVADAFGKDAKATFGNVLDALAKQRVDSGEFDNAVDAREALESYYAKLADDAAKERAKVGKKLVMPTIDLSAFKKASK